MKCHLLSRDLMFSSQVGGPARAANLELCSAATVDQIASSTERSDVVILDLSFPFADLSADIAAILAAESPPKSIVAIGPHVHEEKLDAARRAGCLVLSKGQASRELASVLQQIVADSE